ncbi:odorant receptor Or2 [Diachasma alloeum]|uniref:Odorant receptor n=1 Tax=Diachasma alloeum TaxID=454923 RepID=A0A4E0S0T7_9HYME|nr:odorant receptor Or2 [Diachasma alloeum]THK32860.1 odorant receptor 81 [Diachasma alloeum]
MTSGQREILPARISFFLLYLVGFGITETDQQRRTLNLWALYTIIIVALGTISIYSDFYHEWGSFDGVAYTGITMVTATIINIKYYTTLMKRTSYERLMRLARDKLWGQTQNDYDKEVMKKCEKHALFYVGAFAYLASSTGVLYIVEPVIYHWWNNITTPSDRMLIIKIWQNWPVYETPNFEMVYLLQVFITVQLCVLYSCFESFLVLANTFITGQFSILRYRLEVLYSHQLIDRITSSYMESGEVDGEKNFLAFVSQEFKNCIRQHQFLISVTEELEGLYTIINLASVLVHSTLICLCGYQTIMPENAVLRRIKFGVYAIGCISQLFFFSFTCTNLTLGSLTVGDGPYNSAWYNKNSSERGRALTKDYSIMIIRAQRPCRLTGGGFFYVTLDTVKSVLTTAFSYLTLIRQSAMN